MRSLLAAWLFTAAAIGLLSADLTGQQPPEKKQPKKAQPKVDPSANKPDDAALKLIREKTEKLKEAVDGLKANGVPGHILADVEVYRKAAEWIVRHGEWFVADNGKSTLNVLDKGLERAKAAAEGKTPWRDVRGKPVVRGFYSAVDGSVQPCSVVYPDGFDPKKKYRLDVVLHGRDATLTEVKFINARENAKAGKATDHFVVEVYGRGNNAYRWAGETDVFEAMGIPAAHEPIEKRLERDPVDRNRVVLRGFSMGGAGTWHIGLHHPDKFCVIGPGAGFTTTHGYVGGLPANLPDYQEKCLHIYDAIDYAENAFNVPVVAYSGEIDAQKKAADNIENALKGFKEPLRFTHLVAPGLAHQMPAEWQAKAEAEYRKYAEPGRDPKPRRVRFVTYTPKYGTCDWLWIGKMERMYERAVVDATRVGNTITATVTNVRGLIVVPEAAGEVTIVVNGQRVDTSGLPLNGLHAPINVENVGGKWMVPGVEPFRGPGPRAAPLTQVARLAKRAGLQGPIDDAFSGQFVVVRPAATGFHPATDRFASAAVDQFAGLWDRYFRGALPVRSVEAVALFDPTNPQKRPAWPEPHLVLFGDPASNPLIAKLLPKLPITWTKDKLVVNGVEYDPKTHVPVLIYPNPLSLDGRYVVINSGHTFKEADLKGTNALLYPRLGDWAVIKPTPTPLDPAAYEVVAAGLFDENWQFPKK